MDRALTSEPIDDEEPASHADSLGFSSAGPARFWLHALTWLLFYTAVVVAWGVRNSWPDPLLLSIILLPINGLVIWTLYAVYDFGTLIDPIRGQQEQLIACLVLAVGVASGQLLLMDLGLITLATAWLRPARPNVDWTEWLKVPLVLFTALPFWLDFHGSRAPLLVAFDDPVSNPVYQLPLALTTTQTRLLGFCGLLSLIMLLHGRVFWIALPILPAFLVAVASLPKIFPGWINLPPLLRQLAPWLLGTLVLMGLSWWATRLDAMGRRLISGDSLRRWFEERRYPPWLAVLVVAVGQTLPFHSEQREESFSSAALATGLMVPVLVILRIRSGRGPVHSRSTAMVAGGLLLILLAEFMTDDILRRLSMGFVLIGLISWHCFWRLRVFMTAGAYSVVAVTLPYKIDPPLIDGDTFLALRYILVSILLICLIVFSIPAQPARGEIGYPEDAWVPSKRFALILLGLMVLFQMSGAYWPTHRMPRIQTEDSDEDADLETDMPKIASGHVISFSATESAGVLRVIISQPEIPYLIESFDRTLQRNGWTIEERYQIPVNGGHCSALKAQARNGQSSTFVWCFAQGKSHFSDHLYARRILWSAWHLTKRDLVLIRIQSRSSANPQALVDYAVGNQWFRSRYKPIPAAR